MEEKLYFKPASYGKGAKEEAKERDKSRLIKLAVILLILGAVIFAIVWLLRGKTTTSGNSPSPEKSDYLVCEKKNPDYKIIKLRDPLSSEIKVTFTISESKKIQNASLTYTSTYADERGAYDSRNVTSGVFHQALTGIGLDYSALANKFTLYDNKLIITLTAGGDEITAKTAKFFMIEDAENLDFPKISAFDYKKLYENQGFTCETSLN